MADKSTSSASKAATTDELEFRRLLDNLPAGAYTCDAEGLITYFNRHAEEFWGRTPALNDSVDRFCGSFKLYLADGTPITHDQCWMARALREGAGFNGEEIVVERPDGRRRTALAHANPIQDKFGRLIGAVNVLVDISERKLGELAQARLAAIVESSDDAIVSKTLEGRILSWNSGAQRIFGYTAEEAVGSPITLIIPPERLHEEQAIIARLICGERIEHYETVRRTKDGREIDISLTISPVRDGAGRIVGASKVGRDITDQKLSQKALAALYDQLREADRRKDEFLATLAHELRNPLAPISSSLQILRMSEELSPAVEHVREVLERQVNHMVRLVDDLLEVSRIACGKIELRREHIELVSAISSAVETSRPLIEEAGHQLAITLYPEPMTVDADLVRLAQVVANLLNNAAKYTPEGGQIWLTARPENDCAVISVRDNGRGIESEMLPKVFEMFTQIHPEARRINAGLGIGLTLVKRLTEMHGGTVEAHSYGPGQGSEFVVRLPMVRIPQPLLPSAPHREGARTSSSTPWRILVVDDNHDAANSLGMLLKFRGSEVEVAYDGKAALERLSSFHPSVVLMDIGMPGMDGYELARRARQQPGCEDVVLVALSGWGQDDDRRRSAEAGIDHHLVKPIDPAALERLLASLEPQEVG